MSDRVETGRIDTAVAGGFASSAAGAPTTMGDTSLAARATAEAIVPVDPCDVAGSSISPAGDVDDGLADLRVGAGGDSPSLPEPNTP